MEITGFNYSLISNISFDKIKDVFLEKIKQRWSTPIMDVDDDEDEKSLFLAKDQAMYDHYEEAGYNLFDGDEGCFMLLGQSDFFSDYAITITKQLFPVSVGKFNPYSSRILFLDSWILTLTLSAPISNSNFSEFIYNSLVEAIHEAAVIKGR